MNQPTIAGMPIRDKETDVVERALPAHIMFLMAEQVYARGYELRADVMHALNVASITPFKRLDAFSCVRIGKKTDDAARALLHDLAPDDPRQGLLIAACFIMLLVAEGLFRDPRNNAVVVALMLSSDAQQSGGEWSWNEELLRREAKKLLTRCNLMRYYTKVYAQPPASAAA